MTLKELYYAIITPIENGLPNQGNTYWKRQVYADIHNLRAIMLRRQLEQSFRVQDITQTLPVTLIPYTEASIEAKQLYIDRIIAENDASVYVSNETLPSRIIIKGRNDLHYVGSDIFNAIEFVNAPALRYTSFEKWTNHKPKATTINNKVYLVLTQNDSIAIAQQAIDGSAVSITSTITAPSTLTIRAIFTNPMHPTLGLTENDEYPLPLDMQQQLIESLIKKYEVQRFTPQDQFGLQRQENVSSN